MRTMRALPILLALLLTVPTVAAHIDFNRPVVQRSQAARDVNATLSAFDATFEYELAAEPMRHLVRHEVDPRGMSFAVEHRPHASAHEDAVRVKWEITRIVEYADETRDGVFQAKTEPVARQFRPVGQAWVAEGPREVSVGGARAQDVLFAGTARGGPNITLEVAAAGVGFTDEGARVRPQDLIAYLTITALPERGVGRLHAVEGRLVIPPGAAVEHVVAGNTTVAFYVQEAERRAFFIWGGEALLDGRERGFNVTLGPPVDDSEGNVTRTFTFHLPQFEHAARFVMVSGIEYPVPEGRRPFIPASGALLAVLGACAAALATSALSRRAR